MAGRPRSISANIEHIILQGVCASPYKNTWGEFRSCCIAAHTLSAPQTRGWALSIGWGQPGATPGRGWFDSRLHRPTMSSVTEATTGCAAARLHARMHTPDHLCPRAHAHTRSIIITDFEFACARSVPRPRSTRAIFACVILAGSFFPRINLRTLLCVRSAVLGPPSHSCLICHVSTAICGLCVC